MFNCVCKARNEVRCGFDSLGAGSERNEHELCEQVLFGWSGLGGVQVLGSVLVKSSETQPHGCSWDDGKRTNSLLPSFWHAAKTNHFQVVIVLQLLYWSWQGRTCPKKRKANLIFQKFFPPSFKKGSHNRSEIELKVSFIWLVQSEQACQCIHSHWIKWLISANRAPQWSFQPSLLQNPKYTFEIELLGFSNAL